MIHRLVKVTSGLYRGSAPTIEDVIWLKKHLGIKKIVSLDYASGENINNICKLLKINHVKIYLNGDRASLLKLLSINLKNLLIDNGPTFIHCLHGKDRTGLVVALFQCKYMNVNPNKAIHDAKSLGFGINVSPNIVNLYEKLIKSCNSNKDINSADIVSNQREFITDPHGYLDEGRQQSFSLFLDEDDTKQYPEDNVYNSINDQSPTRQNYNEPVNKKDKEMDVVPQVGVFNNDAGVRGVGPTENMTGFIYD